MLPTRSGTLRLFRAFEVDVYVHWTWFVMAIYVFQSRSSAYQHQLMANGAPMDVVSAFERGVIEYLGLFAIVLMHEFGHALACRQVGGSANEIVLWPLGGVAYVSPPARPGAVLWSIAAGPLVNVVLLILSVAVIVAVRLAHLPLSPEPQWWQCVMALMEINLGLLIFNILPIYPLDGGQILQSLLWFRLGRGRSLRVATAIGFVGAAGVAVLAWYAQELWYGVIAFFIFSNCQRGWRYAQRLLLLERIPRRSGVACPHCHEEAPEGALWRCVKCQQPFDPFASFGTCPHCQSRYAEIWCLDCAQWAPLEDWERGGRTAEEPRAPVGVPSIG